MAFTSFTPIVPVKSKTKIQPIVIPVFVPEPVELKGPVHYTTEDGSVYSYAMRQGGDCLWDKDGVVLPYRAFADCFEAARESGYHDEDFVAVRHDTTGMKINRLPMPVVPMAKSKKPNYGTMDQDAERIEKTIKTKLKKYGNFTPLF